MKIFHTTLVVLICALIINDGFAQAPNWTWAKSMGATGNDISYSIALDHAGNVYTTGDFNGTVDFDPGVGVFNLTGSNDIFVTKLNSNGNFVWAKAMGGSGSSQGKSIKVDASGNIYITGYFKDTVDFDPDTAGVFNLISFNSTILPFDDIFVCKLDPAGNFIWARQIGGINHDDGYAITIDNSGNVYTTGQFIGAADFDPGPAVFILLPGTFASTFVSKLDSAGNFVWAKSFTNSVGRSFAVDTSGNVYTIGNFLSTADFDPGPGTYNLTPTASQNVFISKLDSAGNFIWAKAMSGYCNAWSLAADVSGNLYVTGPFQFTVDFDPDSLVTFNLTSAGAYDIFISKLDSAGNFVWAKAMGGTNSDLGTSIATDAAGNVYTTGWFTGTADFDPGAGIVNLISAGQNDIFISRLNNAGNFVWAKSAGGTGSDIGYGIVLDPFANIYVAGQLRSPFVTFGLTTLTNALNTGNTSDIFIAKLLSETTDIETIENDDDVSFYPNPATAICTITARIITNGTLVVYDITGRALLQQPFNKMETVNMEQLKAGMYMLVVRDKEGKSVVGKLVKE